LSPLWLMTSADGDSDTKDDVEETRRRLATLDRLVCLLLTAVASTGHSDITGHSPWQGGLLTTHSHDSCLVSLFPPLFHLSHDPLQNGDHIT